MAAPQYIQRQFLVPTSYGQVKLTINRDSFDFIQDPTDTLILNTSPSFIQGLAPYSEKQNEQDALTAATLASVTFLDRDWYRGTVNSVDTGRVDLRAEGTTFVQNMLEGASLLTIWISHKLADNSWEHKFCGDIKPENVEYKNLFIEAERTAQEYKNSIVVLPIIAMSERIKQVTILDFINEVDVTDFGNSTRAAFYGFLKHVDRENSNFSKTDGNSNWNISIAEVFTAINVFDTLDYTTSGFAGTYPHGFYGLSIKNMIDVMCRIPSVNYEYLHPDTTQDKFVYNTQSWENISHTYSLDAGIKNIEDIYIQYNTIFGVVPWARTGMSGSSAASPIVINTSWVTTDFFNGNGDQVLIKGTNYADGLWNVTIIDGSHFSLDGSSSASSEGANATATFQRIFSSPVTYSLETTLNEVLKDVCIQFGYILEFSIIQSGVDEGKPQLKLVARRETNGTVPDNWVLLPNASNVKPRDIRARSVRVRYVGDEDSVVTPAPRLKDPLEINLRWRIHAWADNNGIVHHHNLIYNSKFQLSFNGQKPTWWTKENPGNTKSYEIFPMHEDGWTGGAHLFFRHESTSNIYYPPVWDNFSQGTTSSDWSGYYTFSKNHYIGDDRFYDECLSLAAVFYANELLFDRNVIDRDYGGIMDDSGSWLSVRVRMTATIGSDTYRVLELEQDILKGTTKIKFISVPADLDVLNYTKFPVYFEKSNLSTSGSSGGSTGGGTNNNDAEIYVALYPQTDIRNIMRGKDDDTDLLTLSQFSDTQTADLLRVVNSDNTILYSGIEEFGGFFTNIQQGFSLYEYGTGSYETGELRFYEQTGNGTDYFALKAAPAMDDYQEIILPSIFPAGTNYALATVGIVGNRITTEWVDLTSFVTNAVIKDPFNDTRNDIQATGDYTPLRIKENTSFQTTKSFIVEYFDSPFYLNSASFDFEGVLLLGQKSGSVSAFGGKNGVLSLAHNGGTMGGTTSISTQGGNNTDFTFYLPNEAPAGDGYLLYVDMDGIMGYTDPSSLTPSLQYWVESQSTASPNATDYVSVWTPLAGSTHADAVVIPKGHGAFILAVPDSTATGGDKRGNFSVDLQLGRGSSDQVTSGTYSVAGGYGNKVSGDYSAAFGNINEVSQDYSFAGGKENILSGSFNGAFGESNTLSGTHGGAFGLAHTLSGDYGFVVGNENVVTGDFAFATGNLLTSSGDYSFSAGARGSATSDYSSVFGFYGVARNYAEQVFSSNRVNDNGDSQRAELQWSGTTNDNSPTELFLDGLAATQRATLEDNSAWGFDIQVVARRYDASENDVFFIRGGIKRDSGVGTTAIVGTNVTQHIGATTWTVTATADTTNGSLKITATGETDKDIQWTVIDFSAQTIR